MVQISCSVRGCGGPLVENGAVLGCAQGHAFDRAAEGYWNLIQPQDRRAKVPGDSPEATAARGRWIGRGLADPLADAIGGLLGSADPSCVIDVGCGEGYWVRRLFEARTERACGIDLSVAAVRVAAKRCPAATWVVANADRFLPLPTGSVDLALSLFGRRPASELARVLRPEGLLLVAIPAADDLIELREVASGRGELRDRVAGVIAELAPLFQSVERRVWRERVRLDRGAIEDALAMTYRGARRAEQTRRADLVAAEVTLAADLLLLRPSNRSAKIP